VAVKHSFDVGIYLAPDEARPKRFTYIPLGPLPPNVRVLKAEFIDEKPLDLLQTDHQLLPAIDCMRTSFSHARQAALYASRTLARS
jgi:hypothetical protein